MADKTNIFIVFFCLILNMKKLMFKVFMRTVNVHQAMEEEMKKNKRPTSSSFRGKSFSQKGIKNHGCWKDGKSSDWQYISLPYSNL